MMHLIRKFYGRVPPIDESQWHKWNLMLWPVRAIDGTLTFGEVLRRKTSQGWEYKNYPETFREWP